jgi:hypothetical protein
LKSFSSFKVLEVQIQRTMDWIKRKTAVARLLSTNHWYVASVQLEQISFTILHYLLRSLMQTVFNQELWLKDVALSRFADTKDCPPSLVCTIVLLVIT